MLQPVLPFCRGSNSIVVPTRFNGAHGQRVIVDLKTEAVVVQTAVTGESEWLAEVVAMLDVAGGV